MEMKGSRVRCASEASRARRLDRLAAPFRFVAGRATGLLVLSVVAAALFAAWQEPAHEPGQRLAAWKERRALCDENAHSWTSLIASRRDGEVFVDPSRWMRMPYLEREDFVLWAWRCLFDEKRFAVRDGMSGVELASWSSWSGLTVTR